MSRNLPVLVVQEASRPHGIDSELLDFEAELAVHLSDFGADFEQPRMVVYPELHLCGATGTPEQRKEQLEAAAEPIDGPRHQHLSRIARNRERTGICTTPRRCIRPKVSEWLPTASVSPGDRTSLISREIALKCSRCQA